MVSNEFFKSAGTLPPTDFNLFFENICILLYCQLLLIGVVLEDH